MKGTQDKKSINFKGKKGISNLYTMQELIENTERMKDQKPTRMIDLYEFKRK